jgi:hypothetical protein
MPQQSKDLNHYQKGKKIQKVRDSTTAATDKQKIF